jgi:hypothetical protein
LAKFCPSCGKPADEQQKILRRLRAALGSAAAGTPPQETYAGNYTPAELFCVNCGKPFDKDWKFCYWCGAAAANQNADVFSRAEAASAVTGLSCSFCGAPLGGGREILRKMRRAGNHRRPQRAKHQFKPAKSGADNSFRLPRRKLAGRLSAAARIYAANRLSAADSLSAARVSAGTPRAIRAALLSRQTEKKSRASLSRTFCSSAPALQ